MKKAFFGDVTTYGFCDPDDGGAKFLRNVGSYKSHTANIPEDAILQIDLPAMIGFLAVKINCGPPRHSVGFVRKGVEVSL
jgi:hypothetical protein